MNDLFGETPAEKLFRDIRNQRDAVAEEKAVLCKQLNELCMRFPPSMNGASIQRVRAWKHDQEKSLKTLKSTRSSRTELQTAVNRMCSYLEVKEQA